MCLFLFQIWFALVYLWKCAMHNTPKCIQVRQDLWCLHSTVVLVKYDSRCISCIMLFQDAVVPLCFCLANTYYPSSAFLLSAKLAKRMSRWYANMLSAAMLICHAHDLILYILSTNWKCCQWCISCCRISHCCHGHYAYEAFSIYNIRFGKLQRKYCINNYSFKIRMLLDCLAPFAICF